MTLRAARPTAAIVAVGNELLLGETVDENSAWLGRTLTTWGFDIVLGFTVPDDAGSIRRAVAGAAERADVVLVTGGLGPTEDDRTKAAVARMLGVELVRDETVFRALGDFRASERDVPTLSRGQADVPAGARTLPNPVGTAPGLILRGPSDAWIVLLPGVPSEMKAVVDGGLRGELTEVGFHGPSTRHRVLHTAGVAEPRLAEIVQPRWSALTRTLDADVSLAYLPDELGVELRLTVRGLASGEAEACLDHLAAGLEPELEAWVFESGSGDLAEAVGLRLRSRALTMATAESCTGGLMAQRISMWPGASSCFLGSVVAYHDEVKRSLLGVSAADLAEHGSVSGPVAKQMARGVAHRLGADVGVAITGVAGPGGGSEQKPVGTVWIAVFVQNDVRAVRHRFGGDRGAVRRRSAQAALLDVYRRIEEVGSSPRHRPDNGHAGA